ncbi:MAG: hypothetical protein MR364_08665 [Oscillospiraceae bacterium]|nr:hypothetical protein [Oscillospiraceae bacterium]
MHKISLDRIIRLRRITLRQPVCAQFVQSAADTKSEGVRPSGTGRAAQKGERTINLTAQSNDNNYAVLP